MNNLLLIFLIALVAFASAAKLPNEWEGHVVGGSTASPGQFPHQASLRSVSANSHFCGGVIISSNWVLSAAHCTFGRNPGNTQVVVGSLSRTIGGIVHRLDRIVNHPNYNMVSLANDICLLQTSTQMAGANIASRPLSSSFVGGGVNVHVSGWGQTSVSYIFLNPSIIF